VRFIHYGVFGLLFPFLPLIVVQTLSDPRCLLFRRYVISSSFYLLVRTLSFHYILVMKFGLGPWWKMLINARKMRFLFFDFSKKYMTSFKFCITILLPPYHMAVGPKRNTIHRLKVLQCSTRCVARRLWTVSPCGTVAPPIVVPHDVGFSSF
jgi:hypothetical protein